MIIRRFLLWAREATPGQRAEAIAALARAYLYSDLSPGDRWEAETAMTALLDDPSPLVRRALAEAFANAAEAPRHLVVALANDQSDVAALVLARSGVLEDADLVDCAALGDALAQTAIAQRPALSAGVAAALAEIAPPSVLAVLVANSGAEIAATSLSRIVERHGTDPHVREALLRRPDLPLDVRQALAASLGTALLGFVSGCGWLSPERGERVVREARERATVALAGAGGRAEVARLVVHLRDSGQLTPALILRAILSRAIGFAEAAFADLAGLEPRRVAGLLADSRAAGFGALYRRAGLPPALRPAFEAALSAQAEGLRDEDAAEGARLSRRMIERALTACADLPGEEAGRLLALLRRYEAEAAREEAREIADALADEAALSAVLEHAPGALLEGDRFALARAA